jgi:hypothetical protein
MAAVRFLYGAQIPVNEWACPRVTENNNAMKTPRFLILMLTALFAFLAPRPAEARVEVSFDFFYDSLAPYGEWVQVADYGYCWRPTDVDRDWVPYADGYWAYTDAGWTWVSYEDYGGIVYHYGRWVRVEDEGWCWVPDYEWGPAWVSWRNNDDYVGWAPLPPEARWRPSVGISIWVDRDCDIGPAYYNFCRVGDFGAPVLRPVIINRIENVTIIRRTVNITNITYNNHYGSGPVIYNGGPNYTVINQRSNRRVPALKLVQNVNIDLSGLRDAPRGDRRRNFNGQAVGNQLIVTAPFVKPPTDPAFLKPKVTKVFAADKVTHGWNGVKNDEVRKELKQEMQRQTKGLTAETTPARAVAVADLKVLPEKADPQATSPVATRDQRDRPGKNGRTPDVAGQPSSPNAGYESRTKPAIEATMPPNAEGRPNEKTAREKGRDPQKPVASESGLKPFNPVAETEQKTRKSKAPAGIVPEAGTEPQVTKPADDTGRMRDAERQAEAARQRQQEQAEARQQKAFAEQERAARKQAAEAAVQQKQQMEAQRQAEGLRQQQKEEAAATRQRMQAEQGRAARQQSEAAAAQQQKKQENMLRRQQNEQQAAEQQQRRQMMEQQRSQRDAAEQGRRAQEAQREQMRQPREIQRQQPAAQPPSATPAEADKEGRKKKKDN